MFVENADLFAVQQPKGRYLKSESKPLTCDEIEAHLRGEQTIGTYQAGNNMVRWCCIDIDDHEGTKENWVLGEQIVLERYLKRHNIPYLREASGSPHSLSLLDLH